MSDEPLVMFDEDCGLRIYDPERFSQSQELQQQSAQFTDKLQRFKDLIQNFINVVQAQGTRIENEKLRAIGMRNKVEGEGEIRKRKEHELQHLIKEKQTELDRYVAEYNAISKVEAEQRALIEKLSSSE
eukprot:TRINITY_DN3000_c0_g1_i1.p2 TRINITY_DN3000_c0_g1~~TRINITY_DN3000_c0_g1_i1.p2  ORF type:complete len:129 (-),score=44.62 TRINITY_DN3000_c0_g1_i1:268-654(-)